MKKFTLLFFTCMMAFVSCKDENGGPDSTGPDIEPPPAEEAHTLPRQVVVRSNGEVAGYTITYQSGTKKINKITKTNGAVETYRYNDQNLIERIDYGNDGYVSFFYNNDVLTRSESSRSGQLVEKTEYTYPSNNKVTFVQSKYENNAWESDAAITLEFDSKGNVTKGGQGGLQATLSYDIKNTPFLNVEGWSKINFTGGIPLGDNVDISDIVGRRNNPTSTKVIEGGASLLDLAFSYEFTDTENAKFPTRITGKDDGQTKFTAEICYSGNCNLSTDPDNPGDPNGPNPETETLPATIVMTSGGDTKTYTIVYQENSKKIDKITEAGGASTTYIYDGERIQKVSLGSANSEDYNLYSYDGSGRLTKDENHRSGGDTDVAEFSYSGTKTIVSGEGVGDMQVELSYDSKGNFTDATLSKGGTTAGQVSITYDDKNAPFMNVVGWKKIRYLVGAPLGENIGLEDIMGSGNNPSELTGTMGGDNVKVTYVYEFADSKNPKFPTKVTGTKKVGTDPAETFVAEITYKP